MKTRIKITVASLIMFIVAELTMFTNVQAEQIVLTNNEEHFIIVDKNGEGDYKTIQEAINNAQSGSTVYVKKGEYKEIITIKKQISLLGEDKDSTLISPISEKNKYAICLGAPGVTISHLSIKNGAPGLYASGIRVTSSDTQIRDCNIYDTPVGIIIWTSNNIIDNCNFWGCTDEGIALIGTQYSDCKNNKITFCIFQNNCDGIELQHSSSNTISNCDFYENTHTGIDAIASSNDKNIISDCKIYNNEVHGVYLSSSSENQIKDCFFYNNDDGNIVMNKNSKANLLTSNLESNSEDDRLRIKDVFRYFLSRRSNLNVRGMISILRSFTSF
jgi:parallel beta-helix repeat protein